MNVINNLHALAYFHTLPNVTQTMLRAIWRFYDGEVYDAIYHLRLEFLLETGISREQATEMVAAHSPQELEKISTYIDYLGIDMMLEHDVGFPTVWRYIKPRPFLIYMRGNSDLFDETMLGVVGSRKASPYGISAVKYLLPAIVKKGVVIVSGLAAGIDGISHQIALDGGVPTIGIVGTGVDIVYPRAHKKLMEDIINNSGCILSEFPLGSEPRAFHFPMRNRLIGSLPKALLVVEGGEKSGTLITAHHALEAGNEVYAVPGSIFSLQSRGTNTLLQNSLAHPCVSPEGLLHLYGFIEDEKKEERALDDKSSPLRFFQHEFESKDVIFLRTKMSFEEFQAMLTELELIGDIEEKSGFFRRR